MAEKPTVSPNKEVNPFYQRYTNVQDAERVIRDRADEVFKLVLAVTKDAELSQKIYIHILTKAIHGYDGRVTLGKYINGIAYRHLHFHNCKQAYYVGRNAKYDSWKRTEVATAKNFYLERQQLDQDDLFQFLLTDLDQLTARIVRLRFYDNHTHDEIAKMLSLTPSTVKGHLNMFVENSKPLMHTIYR